MNGRGSLMRTNQSIPSLESRTNSCFSPRVLHYPLRTPSNASNIHSHPSRHESHGYQTISIPKPATQRHTQVPGTHITSHPSSTCSYCSGSRYSHSVPCSAALLLAMAGTTPSIWLRLLRMLSMWLPICCPSATSSSSCKSYANTLISTTSKRREKKNSP